MSRQQKVGTFLALIMIVAIMSPITSVNATPSEESEYYYGVEYDWSSLDSDIQNVTGLDIQGLFTEIMDDADDAGFNLDIGQLTSGSSNVYVHQTEDISPQTIEDADGNDITVWSRSSDVVLRHGLLSNAVIMTDWSETTFGSDPTGFDIDVLATAENYLVVDVLYTEYLNDAYELVGSDIGLDLTIGNDADLSIDIEVEGDGEEFVVDFSTGIEFSYSVETDAIWRLGAPSPIYTEAAQNEYTSWECSESADQVGVTEIMGGDGAEVIDECGDIVGTYSGTADYNVFIEGIPTEEFGLDEGEFDISISDIFNQAGDYSEPMEIDELEFEMSSEEVFEVDLGDGNTINAVACETCPPGSPVMFMMIGNALAQASISFGEAVAEDFEDELEESLGEILEDVFGGEDDGGNYDDDNGLWMCDNGEMIWEWEVNNGMENCEDGSDEMDFYITIVTSSDWESGEDFYAFNGQLDHEMLGYESIPEITCQESWGERQLTIDNVNDGWEDCDDGSDEYNSSNPTSYTCEDGSIISLEAVNNGSEECADGSDEPADNEGDWFYCDGDHIPMQWLNNGQNNCENGADEYSDNNSDFYCNSDSTMINFSLVNNGVDDCTEGEDEGEATVFFMDLSSDDNGDGNALISASGVLVCASWHCDINAMNSHYHYMSGTGVSPNYGEMELCTSGQVRSESGEIIATFDETCDDLYNGPEIREWETGIEYHDDDEELYIFAKAGEYGESFDDVTLEITVNRVEDGQSTLVLQNEVEFMNESEITYEEFIDFPGAGEYCAEFDLVQGSTVFQSYEDCISVEDGPDVSDRLVTIAEAFAESGLEEVLEQFGENLEMTFEEVEENEVPEIPYTDGAWAPLWSNEHATIVGVSVYAWDEDGNGFVLAGPETEGYSNYPPMVFASINYITGVPAQEAQEEMADNDELDEIFDVEIHDLTILEEALEDAGVDTSDLGLTEAETPETNEETNEEEQTAEELAEDGGLIPFISPAFVLAILAIAAFAIPRKKED